MVYQQDCLGSGGHFLRGVKLEAERLRFFLSLNGR